MSSATISLKPNETDVVEKGFEEGQQACNTEIGHSRFPRLKSFAKKAAGVFDGFRDKIVNSTAYQYVHEQSSNFVQDFSAAYKMWRMCRDERAAERYQKSLYESLGNLVDDQIDKNPEFASKYKGLDRQSMINSFILDTADKIRSKQNQPATEAVPVSVDSNNVNAARAVAGNASVDDDKPIENMDNVRKTQSQPTEDASAPEATAVETDASKKAVNPSEVASDINKAVDDKASTPSAVSEKKEQLQKSSENGAGNYFGDMRNMLDIIEKTMTLRQNMKEGSPEYEAMTKQLCNQIGELSKGVNAVKNRVKSGADVPGYESKTKSRENQKADEKDTASAGSQKPSGSESKPKGKKKYPPEYYNAYGKWTADSRTKVVNAPTAGENEKAVEKANDGPDV